MYWQCTSISDKLWQKLTVLINLETYRDTYRVLRKYDLTSYINDGTEKLREELASTEKKPDFIVSTTTDSYKCKIIFSYFPCWFDELILVVIYKAHKHMFFKTFSNNKYFYHLFRSIYGGYHSCKKFLT